MRRQVKTMSNHANGAALSFAKQLDFMKVIFLQLANPSGATDELRRRRAIGSVEITWLKRQLVERDFIKTAGQKKGG